MIRVLVAPTYLDLSAHSSIPDPVRQKCNALGFQTIYDIPLPEQLSVRETLLDEHLAYLAGIKTATTLPFSVFSWLADWMRWSWSTVPTDRWERIIEKGTTCAKYYSEIMYVTTGPSLSYDGYTWLDTRNGDQTFALSKYVVAILGQEGKVKKA